MVVWFAVLLSSRLLPLHHKKLKLITSKGYPGQEYFVQTPDGYILGLHRIPYGKDQNPDEILIASVDVPFVSALAT